jgi:hypothetical protein
MDFKLSSGTTNNIFHLYPEYFQTKSPTNWSSHWRVPGSSVLAKEAKLSQSKDSKCYLGHAIEETKWSDF